MLPIGIAESAAMAGKMPVLDNETQPVCNRVLMGTAGIHNTFPPCTLHLTLTQDAGNYLAVALMVPFSRNYFGIRHSNVSGQVLYRTRSRQLPGKIDRPRKLNI